MVHLPYRKDTFKVVSGAHLGRLKKVRIGHDNRGLGAAWYLNKVSVCPCSYRRGSFTVALYKLAAFQENLKQG